MKIVVLNGSPRKNGNSAKVIAAFADEARKIGHEVTIFDTAFMKIATCRNCGNCYSRGKPCIFDDDFNVIAQEIEKSEAVVFSSPLYWGGFTGCIKCCIDRFACFYYSKRSKPMKCALFSTCDASTVLTLENGFSGMFAIYRSMLRLLNGEHVGEVLVPKVSRPDDVLKTDALERARELARMF